MTQRPAFQWLPGARPWRVTTLGIEVVPGHTGKVPSSSIGTGWASKPPAIAVLLEKAPPLSRGRSPMAKDRGRMGVPLDIQARETSRRRVAKVPSSGRGKLWLGTRCVVKCTSTYLSGRDLRSSKQARLRNTARHPSRRTDPSVWYSCSVNCTAWTLLAEALLAPVVTLTCPSHIFDLPQELTQPLCGSAPLVTVHCPPPTTRPPTIPAPTLPPQLSKEPPIRRRRRRLSRSLSRSHSAPALGTGHASFASSLVDPLSPPLPRLACRSPCSLPARRSRVHRSSSASPSRACIVPLPGFPAVALFAGRSFGPRPPLLSPSTSILRKRRALHGAYLPPPTHEPTTPTDGPFPTATALLRCLSRSAPRNGA